MNEKTRIVPSSHESPSPQGTGDTASAATNSVTPSLRSSRPPVLGESNPWGNNLHTFRAFFVWSILLTIVVAYFFPDNWFLVCLRFGVVGTLAFWGFRLAYSERVEAGHRVQTAGYLEALIGIGAALLLIYRGEKSGIEGVAGPIATSLGTSIVGWLLGGELVGHSHNSGGSFGIGHGAPIGEDSGFSRELLQAQSRYLRIVDEVTASLAKAGEAHVDLVKATNDSSREGVKLASGLAERIRDVQAGLEEGLAALEKGTNRGMVASAEELRKNLQQASIELKEAMGAVTNSAKEFRDFTREAKLLVQSLDEMMRYIASIRGKS